MRRLAAALLWATSVVLMIPAVAVSMRGPCRRLHMLAGGDASGPAIQGPSLFTFDGPVTIEAPKGAEG